MQLLVISHPCVTEVNQKFYAEVERQTGWELTLVAPSSWESPYGTRSFERWRNFDGDLRPVPVWFSGNVPLHVYKSTFIPLLREVDPDAIHLHHEPYAAATAQMYLANTISRQCPIGFFTWQNIEKSYPPPFSQLESMVYRLSNYAISGSQSARSVLRSKGYSGPAPIIPAAVDPDRFVDAQGEESPPALETHDSSPVIGFVGRVVQEKGLSTFLDALSLIQDRPWHFVLIGEGDFLPDLKSKAAQLGIRERISFLGYVAHTDIPRYLSGLDLAVLPSETQSNWKEQFGRIIVEALAAGTSVLGSDSGEIPHLIERTGGGLTFAEGEPYTCAEQLTRLLTEDGLRSRLARRGQNYVISHYTHEHLAQCFVDTIRAAV